MDAVQTNWKEIDISTSKGLRALDQIISRRTGGSGNCVNCFYTTDTNQALELVEDLEYRLTNKTDGWFSHPESKYRVAIMEKKGYHVLANEYAPTPALAICRAWLAYTDKQPQAPAPDGGG